MKQNTKNFPFDRPTSIYTWNINGIKSIIEKGELKKFFFNYSPDILAIQEIKTDQDKIDLFKQFIPEEYL